VEAFGYAKAIRREVGARDGAAHFAEKWIGCARNRLNA